MARAFYHPRVTGLPPGAPGAEGCAGTSAPQHGRSLTAPAGPQVQSYTEHHCSNATDRRILYMFLDLCAELSKLCQRFEALHAGTPVTNSLLDKCKTLVSQSNDLSGLRARSAPRARPRGPLWACGAGVGQGRMRGGEGCC